MSEILPETIPINLAASWLSKKLGWKITTDYFRELHNDGIVKLNRYTPDFETAYALLKVDPSERPREFLDAWSIARDDLIALAEPGRQEREVEAPPVQQKFPAQDAALLEAIKNAGYDAQKLPANKPGKPGVRAEMKSILLLNTSLFTDAAFEHAWKRLDKHYRTGK